jgi:hypothetical protein
VSDRMGVRSPVVVTMLLFSWYADVFTPACISIFRVLTASVAVAQHYSILYGRSLVRSDRSTTPVVRIHARWAR